MGRFVEFSKKHKTVQAVFLLLPALAVLLAVVLKTWIITGVNAIADRLPPCIFNSLTGLQCPGCGMTRAVRALSRLDIVGSFMFNPIPVLVILLLLLWWAQTVLAFFNKRVRLLPRSPVTWAIAFGALALLLLARNFYSF